MTTHGVLAFGDSITNAGGEIQLGVALQSWALWTARGLGISYTPYAVDGATVTDVLERQIPLFQRVNADPDARFHLGCLYVGTNDCRLPGWDPARFEAELETAFAFLAERCERTLTATIPARMGRPPNPAAIYTANLAIRAAGAAHGVLVLDLTDFGARNTMMFDHVHPTALGQVAIAERALALLNEQGMATRVHPSQLINPHISRFYALHDDLRYIYRVARSRLVQGGWSPRRRGR